MLLLFAMSTRHRPRGKNKVARNKKWKKQVWVFIYYIEYSKF